MQTFGSAVKGGLRTLAFVYDCAHGPRLSASRSLRFKAEIDRGQVCEIRIYCETRETRAAKGRLLPYATSPETDWRRVECSERIFVRLLGL